MLQSIKSQVQAQVNGIAQGQEALGVDKSGRTVRSYEQCKPILKNILDRPEYSGKLPDVSS